MILVIVIILFIGSKVLCRDEMFFDFNRLGDQRYVLTTHPPSFIDIYTNHNNLKEVLNNYNSVRKRPNDGIVGNIHDNKKIKDRSDYDYSDRRPTFDYKSSPDRNEHLESEYGVIVEEHNNKDDKNFVYLQSQKYQEPNEETFGGDKLNFFDNRRPNFQTKNYNKSMNGDEIKFTNRFSYIQKIPKLPSNYTSVDKTDGKSKINDMLKKYLIKLYEQKYMSKDSNISKPVMYKLDQNDKQNIKSKFLDESLWVIKNKTVKIANKFLSLFTVVQFPNSRCTATSSSGDYEGTCYHQTECDKFNGTAIGNCANGYGVCCVFRYTCNGSSNQNCSYFESPGYPNYYPLNGGVVSPTISPPLPTPTPDPRLKYMYYKERWARQAGLPSNDALGCFFNVYKLNNNIQQMRIDFIDLELASPTNGTCMVERLVISGQNVNDQIPAICGYNNGQHVYVDVSMLTGPLQLSVLSTMVARKRFKIRVCQLSTACTNTNNCLQYYTGVRGVISSFNYDQAAMFNRSIPRYFNNLNYAICIRKEAGYCSITYTNVMGGVEYPFQFRNVDDGGNNIVPAGQAGVSILNCPDDYIIIGGIRLCGDKFNDGSINEDFTMNAPVTDSSAGPIVIPVRTDATLTGQGFKLFYTQNPCTT